MVLPDDVCGIFCCRLVGALLDFFDLKTWWQRLLQFFGFLVVSNDQCVQETWASNLEFGVQWVLLYFDGTGILSASLNQKVFHFFNFLRHFCDAIADAHEQQRVFFSHTLTHGWWQIHTATMNMKIKREKMHQISGIHNEVIEIIEFYAIIHWICTIF